MFDVGMPELIVIFMIALVVVGPEKLVGIARAAGKAVGEFQRVLKEGLNPEEYEPEFREVPLPKSPENSPPESPKEPEVKN